MGILTRRAHLQLSKEKMGDLSADAFSAIEKGIGLLNVVTVNSKNYCGKGIEYTNKLYDMVRRNLPEQFPGKFIVFVDPDADDIGKYHQSIEVRHLPGNLIGWFNKLYLFKEGLFPQGDRILYFDLDTVITGPLDDIAAYDGEFAILRDFYRPHGLQSSVMAWSPTKNTAGIWDNFVRSDYPNKPGGDQQWIELCLYGNSAFHQIWQHLYPKSFVSYKVHCQQGIPKDARIVVFHGHPRPHEVGDGWVKSVWKVGGGSSFEQVLVGNTAAEQIEDNIRHALTLGLPEINWREPHSGHAVIVGGGPSLKNNLEEIRWRQHQGQQIFATNNAIRYLRANGIYCGYHVMVDARPENADFVPTNRACLYASQCHPEVFAKAQAQHCDIELWHPLHIGIDQILGDRKYALIGGGSTVALKSIALAYTMGYREFHLYGMDSSYAESHHAYPQPLNDGERVLDILVDGIPMKAAPWMVTQANEFACLATQLVNAGCVLTVHGDGLIPHLARRMASSEAREQTLIIDGEMWPAEDMVCRPSVHESLPDLDLYVALCKERKVAVQAGGNVGIWARRLASDFEAVYTFEPDPLNFKCLAHNVTAPNVIKLQAALGDHHKMVSLDRSYGNAGAHCVAEDGIIPTFTIDNLNLPACDLIQLDIEGYEYFALRGAERTIKAFHPVIVTEEKSLGDRYGVAHGEIEGYLREMGYRLSTRVHNDNVYVF